MTAIANLYRCNDCERHGRVPVRISCPGICPACARDARVEEATQRLASAFKSIHPERRWARALDLDLVRDRCKARWWRLVVGGNVQCNGVAIAELDDVASLFESQRIIITGAETGVGKTSVAVALLQVSLDLAHARFVRRDEDAMTLASQARFVASIDLSDPEILRHATGASLLVLDDAGQESKCGGFEGERRAGLVADLLDRRERSRRYRTIVTTFGNHEQWGKWYGGRIARLYWEMGSAAVLELRSAQ